MSAACQGVGNGVGNQTKAAEKADGMHALVFGNLFVR
jgi:hypothetical protein